LRTAPPEIFARGASTQDRVLPEIHSTALSKGTVPLLTGKKTACGSSRKIKEEKRGTLFPPQGGRARVNKIALGNINTPSSHYSQRSPFSGILASGWDTAKKGGRNTASLQFIYLRKVTTMTGGVDREGPPRGPELTSGRRSCSGPLLFITRCLSCEERDVFRAAEGLQGEFSVREGKIRSLLTKKEI